MTRRLGFAIGFVILTLAREAHAGNSDSFYYSDDAAMTAGSVVAKTRDAGSIWYNPAGLGGNQRGQIDLSATTFAIRIRKVPRALSTTVPESASNDVDLDSADFFSAPHALTLIRNVSDSVSLGFGLFVTKRDVRTAQSELTFRGASGTTPPVNLDYRQRLDLQGDLTTYHAGPSIGWQIAPTFRVGLSIFGTYGKSSSFAQYVLDAKSASADTLGFAIVQDRNVFSYIGTQAAAGVQWEPAAEWHVGVLLRSPELLWTSSIDGVGIAASGSVGPPGSAPEATFALVHPDTKFPATTMVAPARGILGAARSFGASWVSAELDATLPVLNQGIDLVPAINGRAGARFVVNETFGFGFGLFTDRATQRNVGTLLGDDKVDFYGAAAGLQLRTPLSLTKNPSPDALVLSTTLAARYAIGFGSARAVDIDLTRTDTPERVASVVYHEIIPYIGSGVLF